MAEYQKPLPTILEESKEYWGGCKRHELLLQKCRLCGQYQFPHRTICSHCDTLTSDLEVVKASGKGTVYSFSTVFRPLSAGFAPDVPYTIVLVDLAEGPRMMSSMVDCEPENVKIDMGVEVVFDDVTEEVTLPKFRPLRSA